MGNRERVFDRMSFLTPTSYGLGEKRWNLEAASAVVEFLPP